MSKDHSESEDFRLKFDSSNLLEQMNLSKSREERLEMDESGEMADERSSEKNMSISFSDKNLTPKKAISGIEHTPKLAKMNESEYFNLSAKGMEDIVKSQHSIIQEKDAEVDNLRKVNEGLKKDNQELSEAIKENRKIIEEFEKKFISHWEEVKHKKSLEDLIQEISQLKDLLEKKEIENNTLAEELNRTKITAKKLTDNNLQIQEKLVLATEESENLHIEISDIRCLLHQKDIELHEFQDKQEIYSNEKMIKLTKKIEELELELQERNKLNEELTDSLVNSNTTFNELEEVLKSLREEMHREKISNQEIVLEKQQSIESLHKELQEKIHLKVENSKMERTIDHLAQQVKQREEAIQEHITTVSESQERLSLLSQENAQLKESIKALQEEKRKLNETILQLQSESKPYFKEIEDLRKKERNLRESLESSIEKMNTERKNFTESIVNHENEIKTLDSANRKLKNDVEVSKEIFKEESLKLELLKKQNRNLEEELLKSQSRLKSSDQEVLYLKTSIESLQNELENEKIRKENELKLMLNRISLLQEDLDNTEIKTEMLTLSHNSELALLKGSFEELKKAQLILEGKLNDKELILAAQKGNMIRMNDLIHSQEQIINDDKLKINSFEETRSQQEAILNTINLENKQMRLEIEELRAQLSQAQSQRDSFKQSLVKMRESMQKNEKEAADTRQHFAELQQRISSLTDHNNYLINSKLPKIEDSEANFSALELENERLKLECEYIRGQASFQVDNANAMAERIRYNQERTIGFVKKLENFQGVIKDFNKKKLGYLNNRERNLNQTYQRLAKVLSIAEQGVCQISNEDYSMILYLVIILLALGLLAAALKALQ